MPYLGLVLVTYELGTRRRQIAPCGFDRAAVCDIIQPRLEGQKMKRFLLPVAIVIIILVGLAFLTEGSAIPPFLYRVF
jgi:hypothetical protein